MIRKIFTPVHEPHCKRIFCGYCGTHLTYWSETPEEEANYMNVTVGSIFGEDLRTLEDLGLLPDDFDEYDVAVRHQNQGNTGSTNTLQFPRHDDPVQRTVRRGVEGDMTWMEEMIDGSRLGRLQKTKRGISRSADGSTRVEWEIAELVDSGSEQESGAGRGKRKLGEAISGRDAHEQL
jgi:hypothetical protein